MAKKKKNRPAATVKCHDSYNATAFIAATSVCVCVCTGACVCLRSGGDKEGY